MHAPPETPGMDRRAVLGSLLHGTCALAAFCAGCGPEWREATVLPFSDAEACGVTPGRPEEGWVEVKLSEYPALRVKGGSAVVRPARRGGPLQSFRVARVDDSVWLHRPR